MAFVKTTPGHACKAAETFEARWVWPRKNSTVKEARDPENCTIAYQDEDGWFVHSTMVEMRAKSVVA